MEKEERKYTVYLHTSPSGKRYVGITSMKVERRWRKGKGYVNNSYFYNAIQKYGWDNIEHIVFEENLSKEEAEDYEIFLIQALHSNDRIYGYNIENGGHLNKMSEETRRKISEANKGEKSRFYGKPLSEEHKKKLIEANSGENHHLYGKHHTEETKQKMREANSGGKNGRARKVECEGVVYDCVKDCAEAYGVSYTVMKNWLNKRTKLRNDFINKGLKYLNE